MMVVLPLSQGERTFSRVELEMRANHLAHRLITSGVGAEVWVGISIERSPEMISGCWRFSKLVALS
ncbi:MAG: hypothetical protein H7240_11765 [Glaciimonas sp.]|nr:hypothetical protein [Glaciimonas sp.]